MSDTKQPIPRLFVNNLSFETTDDKFREHFEGVGNLVNATIIRDKAKKNRSRGFGHVRFETVEEAKAAIEKLHGSVLDGRILSVETDKLRDKPNGKQPPLRQQQTKTEKPFPIYPSPHPLTDIGANLTHKSLSNRVPEVLATSQKANVTTILITGTCVKTSKTALSIAKEHRNNEYGIKLYSTAGIHPHDATRHVTNVPDWDKHLEEFITQNKDAIKAVGECGLDYDRNFSTHEDQLVVFEKHLEIASRLKLPLFLHNRDAHVDFIRLLKKYPALTGVVHCYTDPEPGHLAALVSLGYYIGITGWVCDERRGTELAGIVNQIPRDRVLIETDAPFLMPRNIEGEGKKKLKVNEPGLLGWVAKKVAECYGVGVEEVGRWSDENTKRLFGL